MINDPQLKAQLKKALIICNILLAMMLVVLFSVWLLAIRPMQVAFAIQMDQYSYFDLDELPSISNNIKADYYGNTYVDGANNDSKTQNIDQQGDTQKIFTNNQLEAEQDIIAKAEQILQQVESASTSHHHIQASNDNHLQHISKISLIITNLGLNKKSTNLALQLPTACAFGFLPYTRSLKPLMHQAQSDGHEIYIYLPLETQHSYDHPGKYALLNHLPLEENMMRLDLILNAHMNYSGVYSSPKEIFTKNANTSKFLLDYLEEKNLIFLMGSSKNEKSVSHLNHYNNLLM